MANRYLEMVHRPQYSPSFALPASPMLRVLRSDEEHWTSALNEDLARLPRRFQPRLGAGFGDDQSDGLRDFDRTVPREFIEMRSLVSAILAGIALAYVLFFALDSGETASLEVGCPIQMTSADSTSVPTSLSPTTSISGSCRP